MRSKVRKMHDEELNRIFDAMRLLASDFYRLGDTMRVVLESTQALLEKLETEQMAQALLENLETEQMIREQERAIGKLEDSRDKAGR